MYNISDIYKQAKSDDAMKIVRHDNISYINVGVKISKFPSKTEILNCSRNGDYFQEISTDEYNMFYSKSWLCYISHI